MIFSSTGRLRQGLGHVPSPCSAWGAADACGKELKVLQQLKTPHLHCAISVPELFVLTFIWETMEALRALQVFG